MRAHSAESCHPDSICPLSFCLYRSFSFTLYRYLFTVGIIIVQINCLRRFLLDYLPPCSALGLAGGPRGFVLCIMYHLVLCNE